MRNSVLWQRGKKIWRPKCAYFVWHPSGALLPQSREREGDCITDALPFGTPDQTLTGDLPLRRRSLYTTELRGYMGIRPMLWCRRMGTVSFYPVPGGLSTVEIAESGRAA